MPLVTGKEILAAAKKGNYGVGAFNCNNMEIVQAIVAAAEAENSPVIIQASQGAIKYAGLDYIVGLVTMAAEKAKIPVCLHLDHGTDFQQVIQCIARGFSSVMFDGSKLPLEENIAITKKIVEIAAAVGVSTEAELGKIAGTEDEITVQDKDAMFTDPKDVQYFAEKSGVDSLAVAIGTAHGQYKFEPKLDFARLDKIRSLVDIPIVMHGSSGVPDADVQKAISLGVRKINIDTNIREAFVRGLKGAMDKNPREIDPRKLLGPAREAMIAVVREKIRVFGSSGKA
ncbi:MAG: class II fructose-1,6-bisphosphate aldolase [Clostridia bacterium]|jgi:fructose-bisphosphate aldolase class II|nr:class II fructose-1,6-bisphosphate aldolase [Clostridia bacterium]MDD4146699.1 class II fructose-1,6-bisphosphate aldolase [Clostridia bacterium]